MKLNNKFLTAAGIFAALLTLTACGQAKEVTPPTVVSPTLIPTFPPTIEPLSPEWIPYNPDQSFDGCEVYIPTISVKETKGMQDNDIIQQLFEAYLAHYMSPDLGGGCRLENYRMEKVQQDDRIAFLAKE